MNQRAQRARLSVCSGKPFQMCARFAKALGKALHLADPEATTHQRVQVDTARHNVSARILRRELALREAQRFEYLGLDQRQIVPSVMRIREGAALLEIPVALESSPSHRLCPLNRDPLLLPRPVPRRSLRRFPRRESLAAGRLPQRNVRRGQEIPRADRLELLGPARWMPGDAGRRPEGNRTHKTVSISRVE